MNFLLSSNQANYQHTNSVNFEDDFVSQINKKDTKKKFYLNLQLSKSNDDLDCSKYYSAINLFRGNDQSLSLSGIHSNNQHNTDQTKVDNDNSQNENKLEKINSMNYYMKKVRINNSRSIIQSTIPDKNMYLLKKGKQSQSLDKVNFSLPKIKQHSSTRNYSEYRQENSLNDMTLQKTFKIKNYLDHMDGMDTYKKNQGFPTILDKIQNRSQLKRSQKDVKRDSYLLFQKCSETIALQQQEKLKKELENLKKSQIQNTNEVEANRMSQRQSMRQSLNKKIDKSSDEIKEKIAEIEDANEKQIQQSLRDKQLFRHVAKKVINAQKMMPIKCKSAKQQELVQKFICSQKVVLFGYESMDILEAIQCIGSNIIKSLKKLRASNQMVNEQKFHAVLTGIVNWNDKPIVRHLFKSPINIESKVVFSKIDILSRKNYFYDRIIQFLRESNGIDNLMLVDTLKKEQKDKLHNSIKVVFFILTKFVNDISKYLVDNKNREFNNISDNIMKAKKQISDVRKLFMTKKQYLIEQNPYIDFDRLGEIETVQNQFKKQQFEELSKLENKFGQLGHLDNISLLIDKCFGQNTQQLVNKQENFEEQQQFEHIENEKRRNY